jgi:hypothetical protein
MTEKDGKIILKIMSKKENIDLRLFLFNKEQTFEDILKKVNNI